MSFLLQVYVDVEYSTSLVLLNVTCNQRHQKQSKYGDYNNRLTLKAAQLGEEGVEFGGGVVPPVFGSLAAPVSSCGGILVI